MHDRGIFLFSITVNSIMVNTTHFTTLAGNSEPWASQLLAVRGQTGADVLCSAQEAQSERGYRPVELIKGCGGWYIRYASGLQEFSVLLHGWYSREEAIRWGKEWASNDPEHREFYARATDLEGVDPYAHLTAVADAGMDSPY